MNAQLLRDAAKAERDEWSPAFVQRTYPKAAATHLALADWLDHEARQADYREDQQRHWNATRLRAEPFPAYYDGSTEKAFTVAKAILGGAS